MIVLRFCVIDFTAWGASTHFTDGATVNAVPHDTPHYHVIAHRLGYGDDLLRYCQEHEFCHSFIAERLKAAPSFVLHRLARGDRFDRDPRDRGEVLYEELAAQQLQRWLRANERPIVSGCDWDQLKHDALRLLVDNAA